MTSPAVVVSEHAIDRWYEIEPTARYIAREAVVSRLQSLALLPQLDPELVAVVTSCLRRQDGQYVGVKSLDGARAGVLVLEPTDSGLKVVTVLRLTPSQARHLQLDAAYALDTASSYVANLAARLASGCTMREMPRVLKESLGLSPHATMNQVVEALQAVAAKR